VVDIEDLQKKRDKYLQSLYELADANELAQVPNEDVGKDLDLDSNEASKIAVFLNNKGYLELTSTHMRITNSGIQEVERLAVKDPVKDRERGDKLTDIMLENIVQSLADKDEGSVFIIMSMNENDPLLEDVHRTIKRVCESFNLSAKRAADIEHSGKVTDLIEDRIKKAQILICDLTGERPNVYYELGFAHGFYRKVNIYARKDTNIHFDVQNYNVGFYKNTTELEEKLRSRLSDLLNSEQNP
jgi:hypothetical protein